MPEWLKKLLKVLKFDFSALKFDVENVNLTIVNTPAVPATVSFDKKTGKLEINFAGMSPEQIKATSECIKEAFADGQALLDSRASEKVTELRQVEADEKTKPILDALRPIIAPDDFLALRASFFLRAQHEAGHDVHFLKDQIVARFGARGARIANLCSAGYFDNFPSELEKAKKQPEFTYEKVRKSFERFVDQSGFAYFVKSNDNETATRKAIISKICANATYGLGRLTIHGIGKANVTKMESIVDSLLRKYPAIKKSTDRVGDAVNIFLEFPTDIRDSLGG